MTLTKRILCICAFLAFVFVWAFIQNLVIPAYQRDEDDKVRAPRFNEVLMLINAIRDFQNRDPERRHPTNFTELISIIRPQSSRGITNLTEIFDRFVYFSPPSHEPKNVLQQRIILVEKLGHYPYRDGGYIVKGDYVPSWTPMELYEAALAKEGIPLDGLLDQRKGAKGR